MGLARSWGTLFLYVDHNLDDIRKDMYTKNANLIMFTEEGDISITRGRRTILLPPPESAEFWWLSRVYFRGTIYALS